VAVKIEDLGDELIAEAASRMTKRIRGRVEKTMDMIARGRGTLAETKSRLKAFTKRENARVEAEEDDAGTAMAVATPEVGFEQQIGPTNEILSIEFFEAGLLAAKAIGRIRVMGGLKFGTGFFVAPGIVMTNHHILPDSDAAFGSEFELNVEAQRFGNPTRQTILSFNPEAFFLTDEEHDVTLVAVEDDGNVNVTKRFGWHPLIQTQGKVRVGDAVNIIQHPGGNEKAVVVHKSHLLYLENETRVDRFCWYSGDTKTGSSGSPVFNRHWEVVALHHKAVPKINVRDEIIDRNGHAMSKQRFNDHPDDAAWLANQGIRISRIVAMVIKSRFEDEHQEARRIELVERWQRPGEQRRAQKAADSS